MKTWDRSCTVAPVWSQRACTKYPLHPHSSVRPRYYKTTNKGYILRICALRRLIRHEDLLRVFVQVAGESRPFSGTALWFTATVECLCSSQEPSWAWLLTFNSAVLVCAAEGGLMADGQHSPCTHKYQTAGSHVFYSCFPDEDMMIIHPCFYCNRIKHSQNKINGGGVVSKVENHSLPRQYCCRYQTSNQWYTVWKRLICFLWTQFSCAEGWACQGLVSLTHSEMEKCDLTDER